MSGNVASVGIRLGGALIACLTAIFFVKETSKGIYYGSGTGHYPGTLRTDFCIASLVVVAVGIPAFLIATKQPRFGPEALSCRVAGCWITLVGLAIDLIGIGVHYGMYSVQSVTPALQFFVVVWYGIFVTGTALALAGLVMIATGQNLNDAMQFGQGTSKDIDSDPVPYDDDLETRKNQ